MPTEIKDQKVAKRFRIGKRIGNGSFGEIYQATDEVTGEIVAIKLENAKIKHPQLAGEYKIYTLLSTKDNASSTGVPEVFFYGPENFGIHHAYNCLVMELLGPSLEDLFNYCSRHFSLKTTLMIIEQVLKRIEFLHAESYIHRDIKPDNFLMGSGKKSTTVYMIDLGLAKRYKDPKTNAHVEYRDDKNLTGDLKPTLQHLKPRELLGTARYASTNAHRGIEQSRRDDIESIGYMTMYFLRGMLPWQGLRAATKKEKYEKIYAKKASTSTDDLCRGFPPQFKDILNHGKKLKFEQKPDYAFLQKKISDLYQEFEIEKDYMYDWTVLKRTAAKTLMKKQSDKSKFQVRQEYQYVDHHGYQFRSQEILEKNLQERQQQRHHQDHSSKF